MICFFVCVKIKKKQGVYAAVNALGVCMESELSREKGLLKEDLTYEEDNRIHDETGSKKDRKGQRVP